MFIIQDWKVESKGKITVKMEIEPKSLTKPKLCQKEKLKIKRITRKYKKLQSKSEFELVKSFVKRDQFSLPQHNIRQSHE